MSERHLTCFNFEVSVDIFFCNILHIYNYNTLKIVIPKKNRKLETLNK